MLLSMGTFWLGWAMTLGSILEPLASFGSLLGRLWVACGVHWVRQGAPMSYLALLCRREHQSEGPGGPKGSMWGLKVCHREKACDPRLQRAVAPKEEYIDQILHHPALAAAGMSHPGLGCWRPGSSWAAWADALLLGLGFWKAGFGCSLTRSTLRGGRRITVFLQFDYLLIKWTDE